MPNFEKLCEEAEQRGWVVVLMVQSPSKEEIGKGPHSKLEALAVCPKNNKSLNARLTTVWMLDRPLDAVAEQALLSLSEHGKL